MHKIIILGAGRVGHVIARELNDEEGIEVTVADRRADLLDAVAKKLKCETVISDLGDGKAIRDLVEGYDLVVGALPGALGLQTLEAIIEASKNCVDISFMPEDPTVLSERAAAAGSTVLYDFGVAPGMSNLLAAASCKEAEPTRQIRILVGGLPVVRRQPWEYTAPFSPADVMEEYIRPARIKVGGNETQREALSGVEEIEFPELGTLEAFYTDGLRSLIDTIDCPSMEEKTLRYPGYAKRISLLRDSGFLGTEPIQVNGCDVVPRDFTLKLLEPAWHMDETMDEFTVMRVTVTGGDHAPYKRIQWDVLDRTNRDRRETSMARTTGFPAAIAAAEMVRGNLQIDPGVHPPEDLAHDSAFIDLLLAKLKERGVIYRKTVS